MTRPNPKNERIKRHYREYLKHADGKAETTIRLVEKAISRYETHTHFAGFECFDQHTAKEFKAYLAEQNLAPPTILSTVNILKRFFAWLSSQPGYKRKISLTDIDYLSLSEKDVRAANAPAYKDCPTLEQIERTISLMPAETDIEKRDRALVTLIALTGIRDGAVVTLRVKHIDCARKLLVQDPREVATKFSKRIDTFFFPIGDVFEKIVMDWVTHLRDELGFSGDDPLFPKTHMSQDQDDCFIADGLTRDFWSNAEPVRKIFKAAFKDAGLPNYTPHSFRRTLVQIAYQRALPLAEFKAWSQNLGHEGMLTTLTSYGRIDVQQQGELVRGATGDSGDRPLTRADLEGILARIGTSGS